MTYYQIYRCLLIRFSLNSDIHNYDTRNKSSYNLTRNKQGFAVEAVRTTGPILWNSIDKNISISTNLFRKIVQVIPNKRVHLMIVMTFLLYFQHMFIPCWFNSLFICVLELVYFLCNDYVFMLYMI